MHREAGLGHPLPDPVRMMAEYNRELTLSAHPPPSLCSLALRVLSNSLDKAIITPVSSSSLSFPYSSSTTLPIPSQHCTVHSRCSSFPPSFPFSPQRTLLMDAQEARLPGTLRTAPPPPPPTPFLFHSACLLPPGETYSQSSVTASNHR